jgi:glycine/D-amino acid oxidase-like deaminating enzyme
MRVVICGGGVIGVAIAWYLALRGAEAIVVERTGIANAASGKSGGFLALDWCDGSRLAALARRSFALHAELAAMLPGSGYRRMTTFGGFSGGGRRRPAAGSPGIALDRELGSPETTAQIDPYGFTTGLMASAGARGAQVVIGTVTGLLRRDGRVTRVDVDGTTIEADAVLIAMGVVDPRLGLAAAAGGPWPQGPQPRLRDRPAAS